MVVNWKNIDTVLLDMDGTLLDLHFDNYFWLTHLPRRYAQQFHRKEASVKKMIHTRLLEERGTLNWYSTDFWSTEFNIDIVALKREIKHLITKRPKTSRFLENLAIAGKQRVLVTNADHNGMQIKFTQTQIDLEVDRVISSHDYGYPKEQRAFWDHLRKEIDFDPNRTAFIDDSLPVLRAAQDYGIRYLFCIAQPDSLMRENVDPDFFAIRDFDQLFDGFSRG